jgi:hypothetical protein
MGLRESMNNSPAATTIGAVVVLLIALGIVFYTTGVFGGAEQGTGTGHFYFYDVEANTLFSAETSQIPPIKAPSGGEGVLAQVYCCGDCSDHFITRLEKYTPAGKRGMENNGPVSPGDKLVRSPEPGSEWVPANSSQGERVIEAAVDMVRARCKGQMENAKPCYPSDVQASK